MEEYSRRIKIKKSEKFDKITSDGVGSLAENASIERRLPVSGIYADGEDEEGNNHGENKAGGYHFEFLFESYLKIIWLLFKLFVELRTIRTRERIWWNNLKAFRNCTLIC